MQDLIDNYFWKHSRSTHFVARENRCAEMEVYEVKLSLPLILFIYKDVLTCIGTTVQL